MGLETTILENLRAKGRLDRDEHKKAMYGGLELAKSSTTDPNSIMTPDLVQKLESSWGRTSEIPVLKTGSVTVKNQRTCNIALKENDSDLVPVTFVTYATDLTMRPFEYINNEISFEEDFRRKWLDCNHAIAEEIETTIYTALEAGKSTVWGSSLVGAGSKYGALVGDAVQVTVAQEELFFNDADVIQEADDCLHTGITMDVLSNISSRPTIRQWANQGEANSVNRRFQFADFDFAFSRFAPVTALANSSGYIFPKGSLGIVFRQSPEAIAGHTTGAGERWSTEFSDILGMPVSIYFKDNCVDASGVHAGLTERTQTPLNQWEISVDVALFTPYNSDSATLAGCIKKYDFVP